VEFQESRAYSRDSYMIFHMKRVTCQTLLSAHFLVGPDTSMRALQLTICFPYIAGNSDMSCFCQPRLSVVGPKITWAIFELFVMA
jgi:hypothetical protein